MENDLCASYPTSRSTESRLLLPCHPISVDETSDAALTHYHKGSTCSSTIEGELASFDRHAATYNVKSAQRLTTRAANSKPTPSSLGSLVLPSRPGPLAQRLSEPDNFFWQRNETRSFHTRHANSWPSALDTIPGYSAIALTPPLTPPEKDSFTWALPVDATDSCAQQHSEPSRDSAETVMPPRQSSGQSSDRPQSICLPSSDTFEQHSEPSTWLDRALQCLQPATDSSLTCPSFQVVAQAMPGLADDTNAPKQQIFEEVVTRLQASAGSIPNITITHVYTSRQDVSLKNAPVSPPATPNAFDGIDYFDCQRTFTNIARIQDYHSVEHIQQRLSLNVHVAPPNSVHTSILERYLPPTTKQEVQDFFSLGKKSYLVDRLTELQDGTWGPKGALLLIYPTVAGARTFKTYYKDPVLDPLLRRFMMLRGLTTKAAEALGRMDAIDAMKDFDDMHAAIEAICHGLGRHPTPSSRASRFTIEHAERTEIVLDRATWIQQFLTQESSRMKQDLIEYQKSGQRMPTELEGVQASPGALAREVEDGIRNSRVNVGDIGIEMGVFVIRRSVV